MNEQDYKTQQTTNAIQQDLETQLRMFGTSMADGIFNGFEGRGEEIGARAKGVGDAFVNVVEQEVRAALYPDQNKTANAGAGNTAQANPYQYDFAKARQNGGYQPGRVATQRNWMSRFQKKPSFAFEKAAGSRMGTGVLQVVFGFAFGASIFLSGLICLLTGALIGGEIGLATLITGVPLTAVGLPLSILIPFGFKNISLSRRMKRYTAEFGENDALSLEHLVESVGYLRADVLKDIRKIMKKDLCPLWFEERQQVLYLSQESYQKAKEELAAVQAATSGVSTEGQQALLQSITGFISVLEKQKQVMQEQDAVAELSRMQETCRDIYDWMKLHPEAEPKMRRFTSYYMPTTLKLLYSYNDVQGQQGENAQAIRRDIGRFLHTLNIAFDNLHDNLLSTVSLDVSAEIAALQGMLAQDGLSATDDFKQQPTLEL